MFCSKCGNQCNEGTKFCDKCGALLVVKDEPVKKKNEGALLDKSIVAIVLALIIAVVIFFLLFIGLKNVFFNEDAREKTYETEREIGKEDTELTPPE